MRSSDREISGVLVIDLGAFRTRAAMVGTAGVSKVEEVRTRGFTGYISNLDALIETVREIVSRLASSVQLPQDGVVPTVLAVHLKDSTLFKVSDHEISVSHSSEDGRVTNEQVEKLHTELKEKITGTDGHALFFAVSRYRVVQKGKERDVENPRGLRVDILKGRAVGVVVTRDIYENLMDVFREYNHLYGEPELEPLGAYSSPICAALGAVDLGVDLHVHLDLGHTSFRVIKLINGRVFSYGEYGKGGHSIIKAISSTLSIPPRYSFEVLERYLKEGSRIVQVQGKSIDTTIVEGILRRTFSEFLGSDTVREVVGNGDRAFTLSVSGGLANYRRINEYISDAGFPEPLAFTDVPPEQLVFHGASKLMRSAFPLEGKPNRNGSFRGRGWGKKFLDFLKREVFGLEEKGG